VVGDAFPQLGVALALLVAEAHRVLMLLVTLCGVKVKLCAWSVVSLSLMHAHRTYDFNR
jgi:hypothetical protein